MFIRNGCCCLLFATHSWRYCDIPSVIFSHSKPCQSARDLPWLQRQISFPILTVVIFQHVMSHLWKLIPSNIQPSSSCKTILRREKRSSSEVSQCQNLKFNDVARPYLSGGGGGPNWIEDVPIYIMSSYVMGYLICVNDE